MLNDSLAWKQLTTSEGVLATTGVNISSIYNNATEIVVCVQCVANNIKRRYTKTFYIPMDLNEDEAFFVLGGYQSATYNEYCELRTNKNKIWLNTLSVNGQSYKDSALIWCIYK